MRVLITGGFGFVGGRVAQHLYESGHQLILGSRKSRSTPAWVSGAETVETDWGDDQALAAMCARADVVVHAAGMNAQDSACNPADALAFNGVATAHMLYAACRAGVKRFIYLSTAHVYGSPLKGTITEETCPRNLHPYATSHLAGECAVLYATQRKQIDGVVLRLSNAFGAPVHRDVNCWTLLANDLCRQAVETGRMVLHTSGAQLRDFFPMANVCEVVEHFVTMNDVRYFGSPINVGTGYAISVEAMANLIQQRCMEVLNCKTDLNRPHIKDGETAPHFIYCTKKLTEQGIAPNICMESEIDRLLQFCLVNFASRRTHIE